MIISEKELGEKIRAHRGNMTRAEFAASVGTYPDVIRKWETGNNYPTAKHLNRLCEVMGCNLDELLGFEQPKKQKATKVCIICGKEFVPNTASRKCCSSECSRKNSRKNASQWYREHKKSKAQKAQPRPPQPPESSVNNIFPEALDLHLEQPTALETCKKDCIYFSRETKTCDFLLKEGRPRGGDVTTCTVYRSGRKSRNRCRPALVGKETWYA